MGPIILRPSTGVSRGMGMPNVTQGTRSEDPQDPDNARCHSPKSPRVTPQNGFLEVLLPILWVQSRPSCSPAGTLQDFSGRKSRNIETISSATGRLARMALGRGKRALKALSLSLSVCRQSGIRCSQARTTA